MKDPHQNMFFYYRGPSNKVAGGSYNPQIEDNTTKSFINVLEFCHEVEFSLLAERLLKVLGVSKRPLLSFRLQKGMNESRPDAVIGLPGYDIYIESKVKAVLHDEQLRRHLNHIRQEDRLLVISNNETDKECLDRIGDKRLLFLTWSKIHKLCMEISETIRSNKRYAAVYRLLKHFIDYLEVVVMTEFNGFRNEDFDFWIDKNPYYVPILKKKLEAFAEIIKSGLPKAVSSVYSVLKVGNISRKAGDQRFAWVAIKKPDNRKDVFNQCNFTVEVSKSSLEINAVIRNGHVRDKSKPIGIFYDKLQSHPDIFLRLLKKINRNARIVISNRLPKTGKRIMPGNEYWLAFFDMRIQDITKKEDIGYLMEVLRKADKGTSMPGVHFRYSIDRGEPKLTEPELLKKEIISVMVDLKPILEFLEG